MILDFFKTAVSLKKIHRQGWIDRLSIAKPESVADHSYSMAIIGMVISDLSTYDTEKILKMILLHDLAESKIGDLTPEQISKDIKNNIEDVAFLKILKDLPNSIISQYQDIWKEYQKNESPESRIVHQLDRLEMALQAKTYQDEGYSKERLELFYESAKKEIINPKLKKLLMQIMSDK